MNTVNRISKLLAVLAIIAVAAFAYSAPAAASCGNGQCENVIPMVICEGENCPIPESYENCPQDCGTAANCGNGVLDVQEKDVDCGGICWTYANEVCDGKDNNRDCRVDEGPYDYGTVCDPATWTTFCYNGIFDRLYEVKVDCGYVCRTDAVELCDGIDNDKDCQIDENCGVEGVPASPSGGVERASSSSSGSEPVADPSVPVGSSTPTQAVTPLEPASAPTPAPMPVPAPVSVPESQPAEAVSTPAQPTPSIPAEEFPSTLPVEVGGEEQIKWLRQFVKSNSIYIPDDESDAELLKKYTAFAEKHEAELTAKFQDKSPTEKDIAKVIKQFSDETYPKPEPEPQSQSFFSKVRSFFKRLFG